MNPLNYTYDTECYPNFWSCVIKHELSGNRWIFEVSDRRNDAAEFYYFIKRLAEIKARLTGFNNVSYDYPMIHHAVKIGPEFTYTQMYEKNQSIFSSRDRFSHLIWPSDTMVEQCDLYKIHHFDNIAKATSLKTLEFNMRSYNVGDLPFPPGTFLTDAMKDQVIIYNCHDVDETERFGKYSAELIKFRDELSAKTGIQMLNFNDTKIGKSYFKAELEKVSPGICGTSRNMRQTFRDKIALADVIFPYVAFHSSEFNNVLDYLKRTVITETNSPEELKDLSTTLKGFKYDFGTGGIHGSVSRRVVRPKQGWKLIDIDVASYYPDIAISNGCYPEHLSETFCHVYSDLFQQRRQYGKKTVENAMLKLALNGVYGDSNSVWSPFYDPQYTMTITVNGQLMLCMLAETLQLFSDCEMIQINTDGLTALVPDHQVEWFRDQCRTWENLTKLTLEENEYETMWIRDVNNYMAKTVATDDAPSYVKRIGCYAYETARENAGTREIGWSKNHSALVVPRAAEHHMVHGGDIREFIENHTDAYDFMLRGKVPGNSRLRLMNDEDCDLPGEVDGEGVMQFKATAGKPLQKVTRYHIAKQGGALQKVMPPLRAKPGTERIIGINKGWKVAICDDIRDFNPTNLNLDWYVAETEKIIIQ